LRYALIQAKQLTFNLGEDYDNLAALLCQVSASLREKATLKPVVIKASKK